MPGVARTGDSVDTGHTTCASTTEADTHSSSVFAENKEIHRVGDSTLSHTYPVGDSCPSHTVSLDTYTTHNHETPNKPPNVYVNDKAIGRFGDMYGDHSLSSGAFSVFANGDDYYI